ncbi:hypothetical protein Bca4012_092922 [Brassica carinata]|nr:unnamed protein product [Brassica oleracea]
MFVWQTQLPGAAAIFYIKLVRLIDAGSHSRVSTCGSCSSLDDPLKLTLSTTLSSSLSQVSTLSSSLSRRPSQAHSPDDPLKLTLSSLENPLQLAQTTVVPLQLALTAAVLEEWYVLRKSICKEIVNMNLFEEELYGVVVTGPEGRNTQHGEASLNSRVGGDDGDEADSVDIPAAETQALETET